jgi:hypothetical protein
MIFDGFKINFKSNRGKGSLDCFNSKSVMNKKMRTRLLLITSVVLLSVSCRKIDASKGTKIEHIVDEENFTSIDLAGAGYMVYQEASETSIIVKTTGDVFDKMKITNKNGVLKFDFKSHTNIKNSDEIEIIILAPSIEQLTLSGSGSIEASFDALIAKDNLKLYISGSGQIISHNLTCQTLNLKITGSGNLSTSDLLADDLSVKLTGAGSIETKGFSKHSHITLSGSGEYNGYDCETEHSFAEVSGSGNIKLTAKSTLEAIISGAGSVHYKGFPELIQTVSGSGSVINSN